MRNKFRFTVSEDTFELFKYDADDEDIDGYECFEKFVDAHDHLVLILELKLNEVMELSEGNILC